VTLAITGVASYTLPLPPSVVLTVVSTTGTPNAVADGAQITLIRTHADGTRHQVLTEINPRISGGGWSGRDCHAPFNQSVTYEISCGPTVTSSAVIVTSTGTWLVHSTAPTRSVNVDAVATIGDRTRSTRATRFEPVTAPAVYITDGYRNGATGSIDVRVKNIGVAAIDALFDDDSSILINTPGTSGYDITWMWVQPKDVQHVNPAGGWVRYPSRHVVIPFEETADPVVDSAALTCKAAATYAATCTAYAAMYTTCTQASIDVH
jgi:hypothetical protein